MRYLFWLFLLFLTLAPIAMASTQNPGMGLGVCHYAGTEGLVNSEVDWFYGLSGETWLNIESTNFSGLDSDLANIPANKYVWLNINTAGGENTVPSWTKNNTYGYITDVQPLSDGRLRSSFAPWNTNYQNELQELLNTAALHINNSPYKTKIKAIVIMGGGWDGEMIMENPQNSDLYNKWMTNGYTSLNYGDPGFNDNYGNALMTIIGYYRLAFPDYPLVLQLGSGLIASIPLTGEPAPSFARSIMYKARRLYSNSIYFKYNSWGPANPSQHTLLRDAAVTNKVGWEPGDIPPCAETTPVSCLPADIAVIKNNILDSINFTDSAFFCLQNDYYKILSPADISEINAAFSADPNPTVTAGPTPTGTSQSPIPTISNSPQEIGQFVSTMIDNPVIWLGFVILILFTLAY